MERSKRAQQNVRFDRKTSESYRQKKQANGRRDVVNSVPVRYFPYPAHVFFIISSVERHVSSYFGMGNALKMYVLIILFQHDQPPPLRKC